MVTIIKFLKAALPTSDMHMYKYLWVVISRLFYIYAELATLYMPAPIISVHSTHQGIQNILNHIMQIFVTVLVKFCISPYIINYVMCIA